jgi:hypothetical protein
VRDVDPIGTAGRDKRRRDRLGESPVCILCGRTNPIGLTRIPLARIPRTARTISLYENHHVTGKVNDPNFTVCLCRFCHALVTEDIAQAGVSMRPPATPAEQMKRRLIAFGVFLRAASEALFKWADEIESPEAVNHGSSNKQIENNQITNGEITDENTNDKH